MRGGKPAFGEGYNEGPVGQPVYEDPTGRPGPCPGERLYGPSPPPEGGSLSSHTSSIRGGGTREGYNAQRSALESDDGRSIGEVLTAVTTNVSTLLQQEMALAKANFDNPECAPARVSACSPAPRWGLLLLVFL